MRLAFLKCGVKKIGPTTTTQQSEDFSSFKSLLSQRTLPRVFESWAFWLKGHGFFYFHWGSSNGRLSQNQDQTESSHSTTLSVVFGEPVYRNNHLGSEKRSHVSGEAGKRKDPALRTSGHTKKRLSSARLEILNLRTAIYQILMCSEARWNSVGGLMWSPDNHFVIT